MGNKEKSLSWEVFQQMGNPENAPEMPEEENNTPVDTSTPVRIHLERQGGNRKASIIKGIDMDDDQLSDLATRLKKKCGVGGSAKAGEIIIQGDHREKLMKLLKSEGFSNVKKAGG